MEFELYPHYIKKKINGEWVEICVWSLCVLENGVKFWLTKEKSLSRNIKRAGYIRELGKLDLAMRLIERGEIREGVEWRG